VGTLLRGFALATRYERFYVFSIINDWAVHKSQKRQHIHMNSKIPGTEGYATQAEELISRYETQAFECKHGAELHVIPTKPGRALDIGAGTGVDAAWLAERGHCVLAVEPTEPFRLAGQVRHPHPAIEWLDDALPDLLFVCARKQNFELILLSAVWTHLDEEQRRVGMRTLATLLAPKGVIVMSLRHGQIPEGRRMFEVSSAETTDLASRLELECVLNVVTESSGALNRGAGITWTHLAFKWAKQSLHAPQNPT
jgi:2-polyprenyl-3-methyl-5-hydroxy-6-metoxy-1,4-benzoquinol methylase